jgi:hypothetical protein
VSRRRRNLGIRGRYFLATSPPPTRVLMPALAALLFPSQVLSSLASVSQHPRGLRCSSRASQPVKINAPPLLTPRVVTRQWCRRKWLLFVQSFVPRSLTSPGHPRCSAFSSVPHSLLYSTTRPFARTSGCRHDGLRRSLSQLMPLILPRFSLPPWASSPLLPSQHFLFPLSSHLHRPAFPVFRSLCHGSLLFSVSESTLCLRPSKRLA